VTKPLIYLATPYNHAQPEIREYRYMEAVRMSATIMNSTKHNVMVFSPIAHSHNIAVHGPFDGGWDYWEKFDYRMIDACDEIWVFTMFGWRTSKGIKAELAYAAMYEKPVKEVQFAVAASQVKSEEEWRNNTLWVGPWDWEGNKFDV